MLKPATSDLVSAVSELVEDATPTHLAKLASNGSVLIAETFVRSNQRDSAVELTAASVHDVPDEFKGGRDLWFSAWFGF
jgi:hypothetical protein